MRRAKAFTLVELLVVISIIVILVSLILPIAGRVREQAMAVSCQANLHSLMVGCLEFAADHDNRLPGNISNPETGDNIPAHQDWLFGTPYVIPTAPQGGTLFPYVARDYQVYRCPILDKQANYGELSNGRFDYAIFAIWDGCPVGDIKLTSRVYNQPKNRYDTYPTPIICQEDPYTVNEYDQEGLHNNVDGFCTYHFGGSYYASIDGTINFCIEPPGGANNWSSIAPHSKNWASLGTAGYGTTWGFWTHQ